MAQAGEVLNGGILPDRKAGQGPDRGMGIILRGRQVDLAQIGGILPDRKAGQEPDRGMGIILRGRQVGLEQIGGILPDHKVVPAQVLMWLGKIQLM
ncbi:MAG: hypothetical protein A2036_02370 [Omnitrophica bacterium GWA2_50_21]|nr:MAG: hypothetical protein A2036_02370 [Omnitrophica bacterium GWA2_50_21]